MICLLSLFVNFYKISKVPPSLSWDEVSVGFDAWSITQDGKDQWGDFYPIAFKSFEEYKYPFHIYTTALFIKVFGLSDSTLRAPSALFGVINVLILFFLIRKITQNKYIAILSSLFLAISPWFIHFSRVNWETNFALCFFLSGFLLFFYGLNKKASLLLLAFLSFGLDLFTYNAAKVFVPIFLGLLIIVYRRELLKAKYFSFVSIFIFLIFLSLNVLNPKLSGLARFEQVNFNDATIRSAKLYKISKNHYLGRLEVISKQYLSHFNPQFLFISGDKNPRHSSQMVGELYWTDLLLIPLGLIFLIKSKEKYRYVFLAWFLLAPLPASITTEVPHAARSMFALGGWQTVSAIGTYYILQKIKNNLTRNIFITSLVSLLLISFIYYIYSYLFIYPLKYAEYWQYGYKKIFEKYKSRFYEFDNILISDRYNQPYIFALYYLQYEPARFRSGVEYNDSIRRKTSLVRSFDKFIFTNIDYYSLPKGKSLIFASVTDKMDEITPRDTMLNPDNSPAIYVYEYQK